MSRYYPVYIDVQGKTCVVVGGGTVAARKVAGLREAGARVCVISPRLTSELERLAETNRIEAKLRPYVPDDLHGAVLAFAATDDRAVNAQVIADARALGIPVNAADAPENGDFITPSVVRRGDFCLALTTGGASPLLTARLCAELESRFGPEYGAYVELLGQMRAYIKGKTEDTALRRNALARLLEVETELLDALRAGRAEDARAFALAQIAEAFHDPTKLETE